MLLASPRSTNVLNYRIGKTAEETMTSEPGRLLTAAEVADLFKLKPSTIYDAAARGRLPCVRLWQGTRRAVVRFEKTAIERVIRERTQPGSARR